MDSTILLNAIGGKTKISLNIDDMTIIKKYDISVNDLLLEEEDYIMEINVLEELSLLTQNIIVYIGGFVVKKLKKLIKCSVCIEAIEEISSATIDDSNFELINSKNRG